MNCGCEIEYDLSGGSEIAYCVYCPLHASAPKLQARVTQLEEALKVAKQMITKLYPIRTDPSPTIPGHTWEQCEKFEPRLRQINEALKDKS